jgi:CHASE3 domain sensor protein
MYHKLTQLDLTELNKVLRLIQEKIPSVNQLDRGITNVSYDATGQNSTLLSGKINILQTVETGTTSVTPTILSATLSETYPDFGWGANWGDNWGL